MKRVAESKTKKLLDKAKKFIESGNFDDAEIITNKILKKDKNDINALFFSGCIEFNRNEYDKAIAIFETILKKHPTHLAARVNLASALNSSKQHEKAILHLKEVISKQPDNFTAYYNLGNAYKDLKLNQEAKSSYLKVISINPDYKEAYGNIGFICNRLGEKQEAIDAFTKAVELSPSDNAYVNLMAALSKVKSPQVYQYALDSVSLPDAYNALVYAYFVLIDACKWDVIEQIQDKVLSIANSNKIRIGVLQDVLLALNSRPNIKPEVVFSIHKHWGDKILQGCEQYHDFEQALSTTGKLRIGYLSADFCAHSVGMFIHNIIYSHNKDLFDVYCYSKNPYKDTFTNKIIESAHSFIDVSVMDDDELAKKIHDDGIHILVDLAGHTTNTGITVLARSPAPVQITYLGYPNTTGLDTVDFRITDNYAESDGGTLYSEKLLKMPGSFLCFGSFGERKIDSTLPSIRNNYVTFASFNNVRKITQETIRIWSNILKEVEGSKLVLKASRIALDYVKDNILLEFERHGIKKERIVLRGYVASSSGHLAMYNEVDITLDTFPYNGTTTTCEALWMGKPVITLVGKKHAQRVSYSILKNTGIEETIAFTEEEYIEKAVYFAKNSKALQDLHNKIPKNVRDSILCDPVIFTRQLEELFCHAWKKKGFDLPFNISRVHSEQRETINSNMHIETLYEQAKSDLESGNPKSAKEKLQKLIEVEGHNIITMFLLGTIEYDLGNYKKSVELLDSVVRQDPEAASAYLNLGSALKKLKHFDDAARCFQKVVELEPENYIALNNLGNIFRGNEDFDKAQGIFEKAIAINSGYWLSHLNLGSVLVSRGKNDDAIVHFKKAFELSKDPSVYAALIMAYNNKKYFDEGYRLAREVVTLDNPGIALIPAINIFMKVCDWDRLYKYQDKALELSKNELSENTVLQSSLLGLNARTGITRDDIYKIHKIWGERELALHSPFTEYNQAYNNKEKLRIGYLSPDFRKHSVGFFIKSIVAAHNKEKFDIYCYANSNCEDEITKEIKNNASSFIKIKEFNDKNLAQKIHDDGIHILVDLSGHTANSGIYALCYCPAPVQITYLGYPNTTGLKVIDYRITDSYSEPTIDENEFYTEKMLVMPESFLCFGEFENRDIDPNPPVVLNKYITFASFNNLTKITPDTIRIWSNILNKTSSSRLIIKSENADIDFIQKNILKEFGKYSINSKRISFYGFKKEIGLHLDFYNQVDILLDTFPYNGTTTTCEALWMGVPVITLTGDATVQRASYSILKNIGIEDTIAWSEQEYIDKAVSLSKDSSVLQSLHIRISKAIRNSILCDPKRFTQQLEDIYIKAWENKMDSQPPKRAVSYSSQSIRPEETMMNNAIETPDSLQLKSGQWVNYIAQFPYAMILFPIWEKYLNEHGKDKTWRLHQMALDYYTIAHEQNISDEMHQQYLKDAYQVLFRLIRISGNVSNLQTFIRVAMEVGDYENALASLEHIRNLIDTNPDLILPEPFLPVSEGLENIEPDENILDWIRKSVSEKMDKIKNVTNDSSENGSTIDTQLTAHEAKQEPLVDKKLAQLVSIINTVADAISFSILEIGAVPLQEQQEPFYQLLDLFPESKIIAFEVDPEVCDNLNAGAKAGVNYFPIALGDQDTRRPFYETNHPMCSSLYPPNEKLLQHYNNLGVAMLKKTGSIDTMSLDSFIKKNNVGDIDFIKIDVQGAELDIFKGGENALKDVVFIISEVEFIPLYTGQPLFGDVCSYLTEQNMMFHKFIDFCGRSLKPVIMDKNPNSGSQSMWADAVFIKDILSLSGVSSDKLLKMGVLSFMYGSGDVTFHCLNEYDIRNKTNICKEYMKIMG